MERTFTRSKRLFANKKGICTVVTFDLPCQVSAGGVKRLALAGFDFANALGRRNALKKAFMFDLLVSSSPVTIRTTIAAIGTEAARPSEFYCCLQLSTVPAARNKPNSQR
jgi:hypothetical protein